MRMLKDYKETRSHFSEAFCNEVYEIVRVVPKGYVSTYGDIAALLRKPQNARLVGRALKEAAADLSIPCHRIVTSSGRLVPGWEKQKQWLLEEGVTFKNNGCVDLKKHLWNYEMSE